jgi:hypothetical protein
MGLTLTQLLDVLREEGATEEEIAQATENYIKRKKTKEKVVGSTALAKKAPEDIDFPYAANLPQRRTGGGVPVDYGDETPEEAEQRWLEQEAEDPNGLFAGGSTAGGIFGEGPIATTGYDPLAQARTLSRQATVQQMQATRVQQQTQVMTMAVMMKMAEKLGISGDEVRALLGQQQGPRQPQLPGRRRR